MVEGTGTDGQVSGRPVGCARVVVELANREVAVFTDASGAFSTGLSGSFPYAVHVFPPGGSQAAAVSVYDLHTQETGLRLRVALPLQKPAGPPPPSSQPRPALRGRLLDSAGVPQPGFLPRGARPGDPGTIGFVWWGAYGGGIGPPWIDSGVTDDLGGFDLLTDSVTRRGSVRPFFAGNYTGRTPSGDVRFFWEYVLLPSVTLPPEGSADLGTVRMVPVTGSVLLFYDAAARDVLRALDRNGVSLALVLARPAGELEDLELARAYTGPLVGTLAVRQEVPVPSVLSSGAFRGVFAVGYAFDASVRDGTGELSVTHSPLVGSFIQVSYLAAPGPPSWDSLGASFRWSRVTGATVYEVNLRDSAGRPVWVGVRSGEADTAPMPSGVAGRGALVYVYANDVERPASWVLGRTGQAVTAQVRMSPARLPAPTLAVRRQSVTRTVRESFSRTVFLSP